MKHYYPDTLKALEYIRQGHSAYRAAKLAGINLSTIYRALKRRRIEEAAKMHRHSEVMK